MSKKKKQKGKKGDEELEAEMRMNLQLDIDTLENNIYLEKRREIQAGIDYDNLLESTKNEQKVIENTKNDEIKILSVKSDNLKQEEQNNANSIKTLELEIRKLDVDIDDLEKKIEEKKIIYKKEEDDKDEAIQNQRELFQQMTVRFQHILENTANKLQERVKMGS